MRWCLHKALLLPCFYLLAGVELFSAFGASFVQIGQNFTASKLGQDSFATPPDSEGDVGPSEYVEFINGRFSVYHKSGGSPVRSITDLLFWSQAGVNVPSGFDVSDPRVVYDPVSQRWFASAVDFDPSNASNVNQFLLAVSATADPAGSWKGVSIPSDPGGNDFADFPTLGVDAQAVYLSGDMFDAAGNAVASTLVSIPKSDLLANPPSAANRTWFGLLSFSGRGQILQPAVCQDGTSVGAILAAGNLGLDFLPHSTLIGTTVQNPTAPAGATLNGAVTISVPPYIVPIDPLQPDGSTNLDDGDARFSAIVRCVGGVLYAVHGTEVDNRSAIRWYRINASDFTLLESGTISHSVLDLFYPSIAANTNGTIVIGCNGSGRTNFVSAYAMIGETINGVTTFGDLLLLKAGTASYQDGSSTGVSRWGDYSATSVDPADPTHFWTIQMIPTGPSVWSTQITELITGSPPLSITGLGTNVLVSWPTLASNTQLQFTTNLPSTSSWTPVPQNPATNGTVVSVLVPASETQQFFRLVPLP